MRQMLSKWSLLLSLGTLLAACASPVATPQLEEPALPSIYPTEGTGALPGVEPGQPLIGLPTPTESPDQPVSSDAPFKPQPPVWLPQPEDQALKRGEVFIDEFDLRVLESYPPQYQLSLQGMLPTPCHKLRIQVWPPDEQKRIVIEAYSLVNPDPNLVCIQVIEPFRANVALEVQASGHYTVWLNGQQIGEIDYP